MQTQPSFSKMVELLLPIWQKVLRRSSIRVDDNFFELGGNPASAEQLLAEVAKVCGRAFPAVSIYHMLTPATMASALEESDKPQFEPPVLIKAGSKTPPVFLAHGIGADILDFSELVKQIQTERPIYAIQSRGIYGVEKPHQRVEDMAEYHLAAIRKMQRAGPYSLIGYSLGGIIMLEVARRLLANAEQVSLLVLIDSYPYRTKLKFIQKVRLYSRLSMRRITNLLGIRYSSSMNRPVAKDRNEGLAQSRLLEKEGAYSALKSYQPNFYDGPIKFVRAEVVTDFPSDAGAVWGHLVEKLDVETMKGDHIEMIERNCDLLALILSRYIT